MLPRTIGVALVVLAAGLARADGPSRAAGGRVLHEPVPDARGDEAAVVLAARAGPVEAAPSLLYRGSLLSAPAPDAPLALGEEVAMSAEAGDGAAAEEPGRRSPTFAPDRETSLEGTLGYYAAFNPTVAPFKRVSAFDAVVLEGDTPVLAVADPALHPMPRAEAAAPPDPARPRDRFWGDVVLDLEDGARVPLPTPGPEARILWARAEPEAALVFERDAADNAFVTVRGAPASAVRLTFLVDVPRAYFGAAIPRAPVDVLAAEVPALPPAVAADAAAFARELGVGPEATLREALDRLVGWFRDFEESDEPPPDTGNVYLDLARGRRGICRHRAYAFVPTALALGIPARFVMNEAHSWVEVKLPEVGWLRVDLGGAAQGLEAFGASDRVLHRPAVDDPLPRPARYLASYSQRTGDVDGLPDPGPGDAARAAAGPGDGAGAAAGPATAAGVRAEPSPRARGTWGAPARRPVQLALDAARYEVFRGRDLVVTGRAVDEAGGGVAGLRIEALADGAAGEILLGVVVTDPNGFYRGDFGLPPDLPTGDYALRLRSPGDPRHLPSELP